VLRTHLGAHPPTRELEILVYRDCASASAFVIEQKPSTPWTDVANEVVSVSVGNRIFRPGCPIPGAILVRSSG
jgi:hypothetical protein